MKDKLKNYTNAQLEKLYKETFISKSILLSRNNCAATNMAIELYHYLSNRFYILSIDKIKMPHNNHFE